MHPSYLRNVVSLEFDRGRCSGCGTCVAVCPHGVFEMDGQRARIRDGDACMECGACALNCPVAAVGVRAGVGCADAVIGRLVGGKNRCDCSGAGEDCCD